MAKRDYYEVLGVGKGASDDEIKKAYRKIAKENHPDKKPDDKVAEETFREATEAYEVLKDKKKRAQYDQFGHQAQPGYGPNRNSDFWPGGMGVNVGGVHFDLGEMLRRNMHNRFHREYGRRPEQTQIKMNLNATIADSFSEYKRQITYKRRERCKACEGRRPEKAACPLCQGQPQFFQCPRCRGSGRINKIVCDKCNGTQLVLNNRTIEVTVPRGVKGGNYLTIKGMGHEVVNGSPGDLLVTIVEIPLESVKRSEYDLLVTKEISFSEAALGTALLVEIPGSETTKTKVRPGIQSGSKLRLPGMGAYLPKKDQRGDLVVTVTVKTPEVLSEQERKILERLSELEKADAKES